MKFSEAIPYKFTSLTGIPWSSVTLSPFKKGTDTIIDGAIIGFFGGVVIGGIISLVTNKNLKEDVKKDIKDQLAEASERAGPWQLGAGLIGAALGAIVDYLK